MGSTSELGRRSLSHPDGRRCGSRTRHTTRRSALANVAFPLAVAGVAAADRRARALEAIEQVGLGALAARPARLLSAGEQQRLALARAWVTRPEVLFLDEPTSSLDPSSAREVEAILAGIRQSGTTLVMSTHNLGQARRLGGTVLFLHQGRLVEQAAAGQFLAGPVTPEGQAFVGQSNAGGSGQDFSADPDDEIPF